MKLQDCVIFFGRDRKVKFKFYTAKLRRKNWLKMLSKKELEELKRGEIKSDALGGTDG